MYSIRFNGRSDLGDTTVRPVTGKSDHGNSPDRPALGSTSALINSLTVWQPNQVRKCKEGGNKERE